jgi:PucR family transcriptional regulator, purine catabolism regulatory protein
MLLREALSLPALRRAQVVAGATGLSAEVRSVHMVDHPDMLPWVRPHQLLLTTGYAWPHDAPAQHALVTALAAAGLAAIGLAVPHFFDHFPPPARDAAEAAGLPLLEIPWEIPFAQITEELHRVILAEQAATIARSEAIHRILTQAATEGRSLQDVAETLRGLLQRAVSIVDAEGRVLAWSPLADAGDTPSPPQPHLTTSMRISSGCCAPAHAPSVCLPPHLPIALPGWLPLSGCNTSSSLQSPSPRTITGSTTSPFVPSSTPPSWRRSRSVISARAPPWRPHRSDYSGHAD